MPRRVHVMYMVPVSVVVDVTNEKIDEVLIWDQDLRKTPSVLSENHDERIYDGAQYTARRVIREQAWPTWSFGPWRDWGGRMTGPETANNNVKADRQQEPGREESATDDEPAQVN